MSISSEFLLSPDFATHDAVDWFAIIEVFVFIIVHYYASKPVIREFVCWLTIVYCIVFVYRPTNDHCSFSAILFCVNVFCKLVRALERL